MIPAYPGLEGTAINDNYGRFYDMHSIVSDVKLRKGMRIRCIGVEGHPPVYRVVPVYSTKELRLRAIAAAEEATPEAAAAAAAEALASEAMAREAIELHQKTVAEKVTAAVAAGEANAEAETSSADSERLEPLDMEQVQETQIKPAGVPKKVDPWAVNRFDKKLR